MKKLPGRSAALNSGRMSNQAAHYSLGSWQPVLRSGLPAGVVPIWHDCIYELKERLLGVSSQRADEKFLIKQLAIRLSPQAGKSLVMGNVEE